MAQAVAVAATGAEEVVLDQEPQLAGIGVAAPFEGEPGLPGVHVEARAVTAAIDGNG
ncbi:hypothetical protein D9M71_761040 [compost metagenome]